MNIVLWLIGLFGLYWVLKIGLLTILAFGFAAGS